MDRNILPISLLTVIVIVGLALISEQIENHQLKKLVKTQEVSIAHLTQKLKPLERELAHTKEYVLTVFEQFEESQPVEPRCR